MEAKMDQISANDETLFKQSVMTALDNLGDVLEKVTIQGKDTNHIESDPAVVAAILQSAAIDYFTTMFIKRFDNLNESLSIMISQKTLELKKDSESYQLREKF